MQAARYACDELPARWFPRQWRFLAGILRRHQLCGHGISTVLYGLLGRIHRYLIHEVLAKAGFTPGGIVLPVSAAILANLAEYVEVLEEFSRPLLDRTEWYPESPEVPAIGNDAIYNRFFDATRETRP